jgi:transcriptional regulator with XRE-family HTH domain
MGMTLKYDVAKMKRDMDDLGWLPTDLARAAGLSNMTVSRFLNRIRQNPRTARKLAEALGRELSHYTRRRVREEALAR